ncbi:spermatogenesis-associated protein 1 [Mastomys coucha]|uniref:spermatogenesis-associated protein 1 n=1 Tax=Mastomys coucha TaxID=35658 RepID=UPI0012619E96|nr:spermatogenesis-associated protein 1 [Mastomys coucha]XP_031231631.1 spermatogenesis-associated protein 1 [Mastomys coucha]XP_031231633.1 spermatogenesis-associated protein 1 [Mastomys coucha]XP_031231634.1 spermatogenesis-associated protein 1 [Mastomys coucha]
MSLNPSRPSSSELVELHVFYVPEGSWNYKLNTISIEVINNFISAGFIRVSPQLTLQALRERLGEFLGVDAVAEKFLFLKCIGNNLAVVKEKQESELKLKSFAPPYALQPELYLLPVIDHLGNVYSASTVTFDEQENINDTTEVNGIVHRPDSLSVSQDEPEDPRLLENTWRDFTNQEEAEESQPTQNHFGNSKLPGLLEESNDYFGNLKSPFLWKNNDNEDEEDGNTTANRRQARLVYDKEHTALPDLIDFPSFPSQRVSSRLSDTSLLKIEREKIIEQMKQVKEERKHLENIREELIKKVEKLFEQNKSKRYHASDSWRKKYFDTKKATASLEEVLTKLREDLELYYKKLLMQLEAREIKMRPRNLANISDSKNYLIIQITEVQHAIDQLKRKLDTDKMKLILEVKMRKQAVSDLQTLKAEVTQKRMGTPFRPPMFSGSVPT